MAASDWEGGMKGCKEEKDGGRRAGSGTLERADITVKETVAPGGGLGDGKSDMGYFESSCWPWRLEGRRTTDLKQAGKHPAAAIASR